MLPSFLQEALTFLESAEMPCSEDSAVMQTASVIKVLPPSLVNRIAAGEVVERPASVVKELVENALDAGATAIQIIVNAGGKLLRISDNGRGMTRQDVKLAFINHATSKIQTASDLENIQTLGFRGEALASISAVSKLTCCTRHSSAQEGTSVLIDGGKDPVIKPVGCATGTTMEIADLFFNTPARLKFLKRPQTEVAVIEEAVQGLALSHPKVGFKLFINDKLLFDTAMLQHEQQTAPCLKQLCGAVFSWPTTETNTLLQGTFEDPLSQFKLEAVLASPAQTQLHKKSKKPWWLLLNGRYVKCPVLSRAIQATFESLVPAGQYPFVALWLTLPNTEVDVNVHPTKKEVRYSQSGQVYQFVMGGLRRILSEQFGTSYALETANPSAIETNHAHNPETTAPFSSPVGVPSFQPVHPFSPPLKPNSLSYTTDWTPNRLSGTQQALQYWSPLEASTTREPAQGPLPPSPHSVETQEAQKITKQRHWRVIGQLYYTYVLLETPKGLMVVDQHIASERWCFERLSRQLLEASPVVQHLLTPLPLLLDAVQQATLQANRPWLEQLGYICQQQADTNQWVLKGIPLIYPDKPTIAPQQQVDHLLNQLAEQATATQDTEHLLATMSCHMAIRAGDTLTHWQMERLVEDWLACTLPWSCPHGRPIAHTIEAHELNSFFERPSLPVNAFG
jgi:DNA mismatch repair protein MutL